MNPQNRPPTAPVYPAEARPGANTRTPAQAQAQQRADAEKRQQARAASPGTAALVASTSKPAPAPSSNTAVAVRASTAVATTNRTSVERYLDEIAPASIVGRMVKFSKDGTFITADDDMPIAEDAEFVVLADQTMVGWIRFNIDEPPTRVMGLLYSGFEMPPRETLGDLDTSLWDTGLDGQPADPWQHQNYVVLQHADTAELFTFVTASKTGRRAVGNLLHHYNRMLRTHPGELPVVRLRTGGFEHRDERVGRVKTPVFQVVGRAPQDSVAKPDTSVAADLDDEISF
jgi:hypothetical protein